MTFDQALNVVSHGVAMLALVGIIGYCGWWLFRPRPERREPARFDTTSTDPATYTDVVEHDWACTVGPWPHEGTCCPTGAPGGKRRTERTAILVRLTKAGAANYREGEGCEGQRCCRPRKGSR